MTYNKKSMTTHLENFVDQYDITTIRKDDIDAIIEDLQEYAGDSAPVTYYELNKWKDENDEAIAAYIDEMGEITFKDYPADYYNFLMAAYSHNVQTVLSDALNSPEYDPKDDDDILQVKVKIRNLLV